MVNVSSKKPSDFHPAAAVRCWHTAGAQSLRNGGRFSLVLHLLMSLSFSHVSAFSISEVPLCYRKEFIPFVPLLPGDSVWGEQCFFLFCSYKDWHALLMLQIEPAQWQHKEHSNGNPKHIVFFSLFTSQCVIYLLKKVVWCVEFIVFLQSYIYLKSQKCAIACRGKKLLYHKHKHTWF